MSPVRNEPLYSDRETARKRVYQLNGWKYEKEHQQLIAKVRRLKHSGVTFEVRPGGILTARLPTGLWCIILDNYPDEVCNELIDITL